MRRTVVLAALLSACATSAPAPRQPAPPTIEARPMRDGAHFRVIAEGIEPALAIEGVSEADLPFARAVLEAALAALPEGAPRRGTVLELQLGKVASRVQLVSTAGAALLVIDVPPDGSGVAPIHAMAAAAFAQAFAAYEAGDAAEAHRLALASVRLHPGDPLEASQRPADRNAQNHLAWALLAQLTDGAEQERWYVGALERSPDYLAAQLGARPAALLEAGHEGLAAAARDIVEANLAAAAEPERPAGPNGPVEFPSPIWTTPRQRVLLPQEFLGLYAADPGAALLRDEAWRALAVEAFERLRGDPLALLLATREIRSIYLRDDLFAAAPTEGRPFDEMLSALIADVARKGAAGLTREETAATLGAESDPRTLALARQKLREQREREAAWYGQALRAAER